jgi:hypothetical protein
MSGDEVEQVPICIKWSYDDIYRYYFLIFTTKAGILNYLDDWNYSSEFQTRKDFNLIIELIY